MRTVFHSNSCLKTLNTTIQNELNKVEEWLSVNELSLNIKKTEFILSLNIKKKDSSYSDLQTKNLN